MNTVINKIKLKISQLIGLGPKIHREFFNAVQNNDIDKVNQFLDAGFNPNCIEEKRNTGEYRYSQNSPLTIAASNNNEPIVLSLLKAGADVSHKTSHLGSAFMLTSDVNIAKILLDAGAYVNETICIPSDGFDESKFDQAFLKGDIEMVRLLLDRGSGAKFTATSSIVMAKLLLDHLGAWGLRDSAMYRSAISRGDSEMLKLLKSYIKKT